MLREDKDQAFVIHFDREAELPQDLTSSRRKLEALLDTPPMRQSRGNGYPGGGGSWPQGGVLPTKQKDLIVQARSGYYAS